MKREKITGYNTIREYIKRYKSGTLYLKKENKRTKELVQLAERYGVKVVRTADLGGDESAVIWLIVESDGRHYQQLPPDIDDGVVVALDKITDQHNIGATIRSADLLEVDLIIYPKNRSGKSGETVARTSCGASAWVPTAQVINLSQALGELQKRNFWVYGLDPEGEPLWDIDLTGPVVFVLGSEGEGLSRLVKEQCDRLIAIPTKGHVDSFNVSVAASIVLYERYRQCHSLEKS